MTKIVDINFKDTSIEDIWTIDNATDGLKHICPIVISNIYAYNITFLNGQSQTAVVNITQKAATPHSHGFAFGDPNDPAWYLYWDINDDDYTLTLWQETGSSAEWYPTEIILKSNIGGNQWNQLLDLIYPIGSIYQTTQNNNPGTLFGGTWNQIEGRFLYAGDESIQVGNHIPPGATAGSATVTLTPAQTATKNHTHIVDHSHEHTISFTLGNHAATACTAGSTAFGISAHTATNCNKGTTEKITIAKHTLTQPTWKYTGPAHQHVLSGNAWGYICTPTTSSPAMVFKSKSGVTAWKGVKKAYNSANTAGETGLTVGIPLTGITGSAGAGTTNNSTATQSVPLAISNHSVSKLTQPTFTAPKLTHSISTQPVFSTPDMPHTVTKSGSVTAYSGNTGDTTATDGDAHNNMPPYLSVYTWKRIA